MKFFTKRCLLKSFQRQRRQYKFWQENKSTSMTLERIEKLNNLGFSWDCRKSNIGAKTMTNNVCCVVAANSSAMIAAPALVFPVEAVRATVRKGTTEQPIQFKTPDRLRPGGGFPLPKPPGADSVTGSKEPQFRDITRAVLLSAPVDPSTSSTGESPSKASTSRSLENLPCEFFSFSRKFTKFPKIDLSK